MKVFIDTNVYINFIRTSSEKLKSLDEIDKLIKKGKIVLVFPKITLEEIIRTIPREASTYQKIIEQQLPKQPAFAVSINKKRREKIEKAYKEYHRELKLLKKHYLQSVENVKKKIVEDLWNAAVQLVDTPELIEKAYFRKLKGNPPGKGPKIGDELEWELMLENCCDGDLTIITYDEDWFNMMNSKKIEINPVLRREWEEKTGGKKRLEVFTTIGVFINKLTGKNLISKKEIEEEKKGSVKPFGTYNPPLSSLDPVTSSAAVYTGTASTLQPDIYSWGTTPTTTTTSPSWTVTPISTTSTVSSFVNYFVCKKCNFPSYDSFNFCPDCGTKYS